MIRKFDTVATNRFFCSEFGVEMKREKNEKRQEEKKDEEELSMTIERIKKRMDTLGDQ